jgi:hypothetical protein
MDKANTNSIRMLGNVICQKNEANGNQRGLSNATRVPQPIKNKPWERKKPQAGGDPTYGFLEITTSTR